MTEINQARQLPHFRFFTKQLEVAFFARFCDDRTEDSHLPCYDEEACDTGVPGKCAIEKIFYRTKGFEPRLENGVPRLYFYGTTRCAVDTFRFDLLECDPDDVEVVFSDLLALSKEGQLFNAFPTERREKMNKKLYEVIYEIPQTAKELFWTFYNLGLAPQPREPFTREQSTVISLGDYTFPSSGILGFM